GVHGAAEEGQDPAARQWRRPARGDRGAGHGGRSQSAGSRAPAGAHAADPHRAMGPESVALSLGGRGAVGAFKDGLFEALPPRVDAVCPIGAGDALTAAYAWSMRRKPDHAEALRWGVAAGTASARLPGMSFASLAQTEEIYRKVEVRRVE